MKRAVSEVYEELQERSQEAGLNIRVGTTKSMMNGRGDK